MTTQLQSRPSTMVFKQSFGFKPGLRVTGAGRGRGRAASSEGAGYCSLPCTTGLDSLKSEADTHRAAAPGSRLTIMSRDVVKVAGGDTNNNRSVSPVLDSSLPALPTTTTATRARGTGLPQRTSCIPSLTSSNTSASSQDSGSRTSLDCGQPPSAGSRIPISRSQEDLLRNVPLRSRVPGHKRRPVSGGHVRPRDTRTCSPAAHAQTARTTKLMSRNSVEVLAYTETGGPRQPKYYSQYSKPGNKKYETASKFTKKFGSKDTVTSKTASPGGCSESKASPASARASSLIPQPQGSSPASAPAQAAVPRPPGGKTQEKKPTTSTTPASTPGARSGTKPAPARAPATTSRRGPAPGTQQSRRSPGSSAGPGPAAAARGRVRDGRSPAARQPVKLEDPVTTAPAPQLARVKLPPKAKFRADDEISIGEPEPDKTEAAGDNMEAEAPVSPVSPVTPAASQPRDRDLYPPSHASLLVARCLEEGRGHKTSSLPPHSALLRPDAGLKSTSLDKYYKAAAEKPQPGAGKSAGEGFFQRLSNLRRSFNTADNRRGGGAKIRPHLTDSNTPFFQGIKTPTRRHNNSSSNNSRRQHHSLLLVLPPVIPAYKPPARRHQFQRAVPVRGGGGPLTRSFSFSDCQVVAQCVVDSDQAVLGELYPALLASPGTALYPGLDRAKLGRARTQQRLGKEEENGSEQTLIGASVSGDHEDDKNDTSEAARPLDVSQVTLTASVVNINNVTGVSVGRMETEDGGTTLNTSVVTNISVASDTATSVTSCHDTSATTSPATAVSRLSVRGPDISPIISPWSSRVTPSSCVTRDNVTRLDVTQTAADTETAAASGQLSSMAQPHPFIYRVQNQLHFSPGSSLTKSASPDPFKKILAAADDNICQAESILSSLGYDGVVTSGLAASPASAHAQEGGAEGELAPGLGSDIETNIRRLELTQAKINAALETFRSVQRGSPPSAAAEADTTFCSLPAHEAATTGDKFKKPEPVSPTSSKVGEKREKKTSIARRHSFNNIASKEKTPVTSGDKRDSLYLYDGDAESSEDRGNRSSSAFEDASDTEANFTSPFKNRIRGIFGSFGKGKRSRLQSEEEDNKLVTIEYPDTGDKEEGSFSIGHFTELVRSLPAHQFQDQAGHAPRPAPDKGKQPPAATFLRPRDPERGSAAQLQLSRASKSSLCHNNSSDTYSSISTSASQSINMSSNRNSVVSTRSNSSESYGDREQGDTGADTASDNGDTGEMASSTSPKDSRPPSNPDYISASKAQEKKVYYIAKEIMTSEKTYVDVLKLINIDFRDYVQKARLESKSGILPDHDFVKLFSNLPELMMLNEDLLRDFQERINNWDNHKKIADVIIKKGPYLKLYTVYIRDFSAMNFHFDEVCQRYPKFGKLVKEFEKLPRCQNLKLKHFMLKPVQRLPQYKLLLEDYLKHLDTDSIDWDDTTLALKIVSDAAEHANNTVKQGDKFQTMLKLQSRLGDWEFIRPGRDLVKEGELQKISRKGVTSRYFALLSDCLLYCSYQGSWAGDSTSLKVGYTIPLNQLQVQVPTAEDFQNEFSITSNVRSCTLRARSVQERNDWLDALNSAIEDYRSRKATFVTLEALSSPHRHYKLGDAAPVWVPDTRVTMCHACSAEFSLVNRRHHCRACGKVVCAPCSSNKAPLRYRHFEASRVCDACYEGVEKIYGDDIDLRSRFKRRDISRTVARFVPQRLKVAAGGEGGQVAGYLRSRVQPPASGRGLSSGKWKRCWFVLKDRVLYTYRASEDTVAIDTLPVLGWAVSILDQKETESYDSLSSHQVFTLSHPGSATLMFCAENENSAERWISCLRDAVSF